MDAIEQNLAELGYDTLPKTVVHGDYVRKNVILNGNEVALVIDWDRVVLKETRMYDIVWAMFSFAAVGTENISFLEGDEEKFKDVNTFLKAYHEVNPLTSDEMRLIPEIYRAIMIEFFSYTNNPHKQISMRNPDSLNFYRKVLENLKKIDTLDWEKLINLIP
ncbi:MAG: phosphotransferase [Candidatus Kaelpia imicola]|nr:phosphotransferase [Candidatus Kaelpia imicola]